MQTHNDALLVIDSLFFIAVAEKRHEATRGAGGSLDDVVSDSSGMIEEEDMTLAAARLNLIKLKARVR